MGDMPVVPWLSRWFRIVSFDSVALLTLAAKRRRRATAVVWRFLSVRPSVRLSVRRNPPLLNGKGRHRESTHSRYT